jgi:predicted outer membrane repeat protein
MDLSSRRIAALATATLVATAPACLATVIDVPDDQPTIQLGIVNAADGDTVLVAPDTYHEEIDFLGKPVTVGSWYLTTGDPAYVASTVIDGQGGMLGPLVTFESGEDSLSALVGVTVQGGWSLSGGGFRCVGASPRIAGCTIRLNEAYQQGAGFYLNGGSPIVEGNRFEANEVTQDSGGGIAIWNGAPRVAGNVFVDNVANSTGGAIFCENASPLIMDNLIDGNSGSNIYAGGIMSRNCTPVIVGNVISNNDTNGYGGGIFF